jgi:N-acyl-D-amino-acid deacylase
MVEVVLRGGIIVDGTGRPRYSADVAVTSNRISAIGIGLPDVSGASEIDASGNIVAPGFIDVHTHDDRALLASPDMAAKASQGVTTVITGNCGVSLAPLALDHDPPPPLDLIGNAADYAYDRFSDYLDALDRSPPALNAACLVGHSTLRVGASDNRHSRNHQQAAWGFGPEADLRPPSRRANRPTWHTARKPRILLEKRH